MKQLHKQIVFLASASAIVFAASCGAKKNTAEKTQKTANIHPFSDLSNTGNWVLNTEVSDEFDASELDAKKWRVVGEFKDGKPTYENEDEPGKTEWIGRAPSQFSGKNYRLENKMLKLETKWEPDFPFSNKVDKVGGKDIPHENITTACIIGRKEFLYGYMEIRCKAADAEISSAFWATGGQTEFDMFEFFGDHRQPNKEAKGMDKELWWSMNDWSRTGKGKTTYTERKNFDFRVADDFHVYGYDWSENGIKIYVDGKLFRDVSREAINNWDDVKNSKGGNGAAVNYVVTKPIHICVDQETFPWHGVPDSKEDLGPNGRVDFEIDYIRVWQK